MLRTDHGLGRRIQLRQGLVWLAAAQGDPYAALLRGLDADPRPYWRVLAERPLSRSATGAWVTARHAVARAVMAEPALRGQPLLDGITEVPVPGPGADDPARHAAGAWKRALGDGAGEFDAVAVARRAAIGMLAEAWGLDDAEEEHLSAAAGMTAGALDAPFYPQSPAGTRRIADGVAALRSLPSVGASAERLLLAVAGVPMATDLAVNAFISYSTAASGQDIAEAWDRLRTEPGHAARVVSETLRWACPAQLYAAVADSPCAIAGQEIKAGEQVVVAVGAANRDPEVFTDPERFGPERPAGQTASVLLPGLTGTRVLSFAVASAEEGLRRLAACRPGPPPPGAVVRRTAAPVSRSLVTCPAGTPLRQEIET